MVMTSDETQIQILANWPMSHAKRMTRYNWKNPEYHVISALRNLRTDIIVCYSVYFWLIRSFTDPAFTGSIFVCGPLHHHVYCLVFLGAVGLFRSDMLLNFNMVWP